MNFHNLMKDNRQRKIKNVGGSLHVSLPPTFLRTVGLKKGDRVEVLFNHEVLVIVPIKRSKNREVHICPTK